jgi:hypothetical protein
LVPDRVAEKLVASLGDPPSSSPQAGTIVNRPARTAFGIAVPFISHPLFQSWSHDAFMTP